MRTSIISLSLAVIIGVVIGFLLQSPKAPSTTAKSDNALVPDIMTNPLATTADNNNALDVIRQQLKQEIAARKKLQNNVNQLNKKLAQLEGQNLPATNTTKASSPANTAPASSENRAWFNEQALLDAGVDAETAQSLKSRYEKQELDKLYVRDQATREGWYGSRRYRDELAKLDTQLGGLQKELGDDTYAAYLYATGQSNRVTVQSVLANSAADTADIRANDQITRYGDQRIYNWRDLRDATTKGNLNESVTVEVIRDGKPVEIYVQRGPLGIRMSSVSIAP